MATILLVGTDEPLLEGVAQSLGAVGHGVRFAATFADAVEVALAERPIVAIVSHALAADARALGIPLAPGGALVLYRSGGASERTASLAPAVVRGALADLTLPLERHRLIALVAAVCERARATGRERRDTPPELRAY
ncbi:MAG: hypothetical protein WKG32_17090 [Gemmatimonadaceae bacterium]